MKSGASELLFFYTECTKTHLQAFTDQKFFPGAPPPDPPGYRKGEGREGRKEGRGKGKGKGQGDGKGRERGKEGGKRAQGGREGIELGLQPPKFLTLSTPLARTNKGGPDGGWDCEAGVNAGSGSPLLITGFKELPQKFIYDFVQCCQQSPNSVTSDSNNRPHWVFTPDSLKLILHMLAMLIRSASVHG
jgi:hypothetical protein